MGTARERFLGAVRDAVLDGLLDDLTASEVARRAGAHRVTFYRFWPDVRSAVVEAFTAEIDRMSAVEDTVVDGITDVATLAEIYDATLERALADIRDHRAVYRVLFAWPVFQAHVRQALRDRADVMIEILRRSGIDVSGAASGVAADSLGGSSLSVLAAWAADDDADVGARAREIIAQLPSWWPRA